MFSTSSLEKEEVKAALVLLSVAFKSATNLHFLSNLLQIDLIPKHAPKAKAYKLKDCTDLKFDEKAISRLSGTSRSRITIINKYQ